MKVSVITPAFNSARFIGETLRSIAAQRATAGVEIEHIVVDGASTDGTLEVIRRHARGIDVLISEPDRGPADAINKGLRAATGDYAGWLNADDLYEPGAVARLCAAVRRRPGRAIYFGRCRIVDAAGREIRRPITSFKNSFFPFSCRPLIQSINYLSQPSSFFSMEAARSAGELRTDLRAAFDYDWTLRLWRLGGAYAIPGPPLASFRWHPGSISGSEFRRQFREEFEIAARDAGRFAPQTLAHALVRFGIVSIYSLMAWAAALRQPRR